eukprot:130556-Rhodomonas_salina.1
MPRYASSVPHMPREGAAKFIGMDRIPRTVCTEGATDCVLFRAGGTSKSTLPLHPSVIASMPGGRGGERMESERQQQWGGERVRNGKTDGWESWKSRSVRCAGIGKKLSRRVNEEEERGCGEAVRRGREEDAGRRTK